MNQVSEIRRDDLEQQELGLLEVMHQRFISLRYKSATHMGLNESEKLEFNTLTQNLNLILEGDSHCFAEKLHSTNVSENNES